MKSSSLKYLCTKKKKGAGGAGKGNEAKHRKDVDAILFLHSSFTKLLLKQNTYSRQTEVKLKIFNIRIEGGGGALKYNIKKIFVTICLNLTKNSKIKIK